MYIDTHAHLNHPDLLPMIDEILDRASSAGVEKIIVPATDYKTSIEVTSLASKHKMIYGAVGIHPTELKDFDEKDLYGIEQLCSEQKIVAIGEIGLDYYWEPFDAALEKQVLTAQLELAKKKNLPVILHNRKSSEDLMKVIAYHSVDGKLRGQFHSFSGDKKMAEQCVQMGFCISFTGNITYKPNESTLISYDILSSLPLNNLLIETDSPYLPPVPHRGKKNEPSFIVKTAEKIAELMKISTEDLAKSTTENALRMFDLR